MEQIAVVGALIITLSLLVYGIGSITLIRFKIVSALVLVFLTLGVLFDISAVVLMMRGMKGSLLSVHSIIGYLAFALMLSNTVWAWKSYFVHGIDSRIGNKQHIFAKIAYLYWVLAYIGGSVLMLWA